VRLLLDEMISPRVARELRGSGHDVQAIKKDRPDLLARTDREIVQRMGIEWRAIVTNDVVDFQEIHERLRATGEDHAGMVFTFDVTMPRSKAAIELWVQTLAALLSERPDERALRNQVIHLP
jgi:predicted nuclease of predicted toxin-antitoxin system